MSGQGKFYSFLLSVRHHPQTVGLLDGCKRELGGFVQRCDVGRSGRKPA